MWYIQLALLSRAITPDLPAYRGSSETGGLLSFQPQVFWRETFRPVVFLTLEKGFPIKVAALLNLGAVWG